MKACNNRPPIQIKSASILFTSFFSNHETDSLSDKDKWINNERLRWSKAFSIPIAAQTPDGFPPSTIACQRALTALTLSPHKSKLENALDAVYATFWIDRKPIQNPEVVIAALAKVVGEEDAKELFEKGSSPEVKKRLTEATEEAFKDGAFGLPWFVGECFALLLCGLGFLWLTKIQRRMRRGRRRGFGVLIILGSFVTTLSWSGRRVKDGSHCCRVVWV
jgi:hypothetical protein